jgi:nucleotide-binding universal stress UspA family protein
VLDCRVALAAATTLEGAIPVSIEDECRRRLTLAVEDAAAILSKAGISVTKSVVTGNPCEMLVADAEHWGADAIFVGARGLTGLERLLLGSVSTAVAAHASCSVEVIRLPD